MLVTRPACFSPVPAVPALGVPSAEGGIAEPKGGRDEPASHSSGSPRNHRRIPLHYPPPAPPYPALLRAGSRRSRVPAQGAAVSAQVQGSASPLCSLRGFAWAWASGLFLSDILVGGLSCWSCGCKSSSSFHRGPQPCLRVYSPALGRTLCVPRGLLLCVPLVRNPSSFNSLTACS